MEKIAKGARTRGMAMESMTAECFMELGYLVERLNEIMEKARTEEVYFEHGSPEHKVWQVVVNQFMQRQARDLKWRQTRRTPR